ncbi:uncharacterized protein LOC109539199 [Dendroctonus ponderosae]|uniref:uncharacterized protein LOC109539199 n=1 Tax=Dendroctonus ponderosae TaxID=77166 RepID=UPI002035C839|nr:uncharacterized protein LOC109539199 [Dendroctonus ponderosae]KAH1012399.1 hypothetical protein HUJ05_011566 [Dendroctonus ponderosae]KAH1012400.1 hypothetical protein HUJ05_011566 [Dendroctonus ponderosae]
MKTSISIDCASQSVSALSDCCTQACNQFFQFMINSEHAYCELADRKKQLDEAQTEDTLVTEEKEQEAIVQRIHSSVADLELAESAVKTIRDTEALKKSECLTYQKNIDDLRKRIEAISKRKGDLRLNRDEILAYKLISNINFVHSTKRICGTVEKKGPVAFKLNRENLTPEQITETLWDLVLKV